jgi:transcriptional regulator with XRE-family HTH domain
MSVNIGITLRQVRKRRDVTQLALAQRLGPPFSQALLSQYERGLPPSTEHIQRLAAALDVPVDVLLRPPRRVRREDPFQAIVVEDTVAVDVKPPAAPEGGRE